MESILTSVKKILGVPEEYEQFDADIIMHINTVLMALCQMGVGPKEGFEIHDKTTTWTDYLGERANLNAVKTYLSLKVRLLFDPPQSSTLIEAINNSIKEAEWRISIYVDGR